MKSGVYAEECEAIPQPEQVEVVDVRLRLTINVDKVRQLYLSYVGDVTYYREHGELMPDHSDPGYATGIPIPWADSWREHLLMFTDECTHTAMSGPWFGVERVE